MHSSLLRGTTKVALTLLHLDQLDGIASLGRLLVEHRLVIVEIVALALEFLGYQRLAFADPVWQLYFIVVVLIF